jgi:hypothetical protein
VGAERRARSSASRTPSSLRHDARDAVSLAEKAAGQFAIEVEDVEAVRAELEEHGVTPIGGQADRDWGMRTLTFADPDG